MNESGVPPLVIRAKPRNPFTPPRSRPAKNAKVPHAGACKCCGSFRR